MTQREERFCLEYIKSGNATESMIKAGYKESYARNNPNHMLRKSTVKERIRELNSIMEKEDIATAEEILVYLTGVLRGTEESEETIILGRGQGIQGAIKQKRKPTQCERLKACELLTKIMLLDRFNTEEEKPTIIIDI